MRIHHKLALAALAGAALGATAVQTIQAEQSKGPPAYIIAEVEKDPAKVADPVAARHYAEEAPKSMVPFAGRYVIRGGAVQTLEGDAPRGYIVVIGFDSMEQARAWYDSPVYSAIKPIRQNSMKSRLLLVEGVAPEKAKQAG